VHFYGIDLGWTGKPSGFASLVWDGKRLQLTHLTRCATHEAVLNSIPDNHTAWIGLDAPVIVNNQSGMRQADRSAHELFSRQRAGCYPVNLAMPFVPKVLAFVDTLTRKGYSTNPPESRQTRTSHLFEVYPHSAAVRLFNLPQILPYKKGKLATRKVALAQFRQLLASGLTNLPSLKPKNLPPIGDTLADLKSCEDQLDAVLCAYIAAHFWYWGLSRNNLLGHPPDGFIVNPSF
jgi:predicted RNase H-like nuclease